MGARCQLERRVPAAPPRRPSWRRGRGRAPRAHPLGTRLRPRLPALAARPSRDAAQGRPREPCAHRGPGRRLSAPRRTRVREGGARRASRSRDGGTAARAGGGSAESEARGRGKERGRGGRRAPGAGGPSGAGRSGRASGPAGLGAFPGGPDDSPGPPGLRAPNKGGSGGGALCAQVRPPSGHGGQRPRRTIPGRPARPGSRGPAPAPRRTHRIEVCGATAGTASSSRCMQRTVVRKHRQRLGHPLLGLGATSASAPQHEHRASASRQGRAARTAMTHGARGARARGPTAKARRVHRRLRTAPARRPGAAHVPAVRRGRGAPAVHMRAAPPFPPPPPRGPGRGEDLLPERGGRAAPAAADRLGPRGPAPGPRSRSGASPSGRCHTCAIEAFVVSENTLRGLRKFQAEFQALSLSLPSLPFSRPLPPPRLSPSLCFCLAVSRRPASRQAAGDQSQGSGSLPGPTRPVKRPHLLACLPPRQPQPCPEDPRAR